MAMVSIELPKPGAQNEGPLGTGKSLESLYGDAVKRFGINAGMDYVVSGQCTRRPPTPCGRCRS